MRGGLSRNLSRPEACERARAEFRLIVSGGVKIARLACEGHSGLALRTALIEARPSGESVYTFGALDYLSDKLAHILRDSGIGRGDRVAVALDQSAALVIAHIATWKTGAVIVPLSPGSEPRQVGDLLEIVSPGAAILQGSCDSSLLKSFKCPNIFIVSDDAHSFIPGDGERNFWKEIYAASSDFEPVAALSEPHAFLFRVGGREGESG